MKTAYLVGLVAIVLSACGGSGGDSAPPGGEAGAAAAAASVKLQGFYQGQSSAGKSINALVLEDGSWWNVYGLPSGAKFLVQGVTFGKASPKADIGNFYVGFSDFLEPGTSAILGSINGTYTGTSLNGMLNEADTSVTFNLLVPLATTYDYNTAAKLSSLTGSWNGGLLEGKPAVLDILADGSFTITPPTSSLGCSAIGIVAPRASGRNVFNIALTFGGAPCALPNQTLSGVAVTYLSSDGKTQLVATLVNPAATAATGFFAER